jgi:hypothetical protein
VDAMDMLNVLAGIYGTRPAANHTPSDVDGFLSNVWG